VADTTDSRGVFRRGMPTVNLYYETPDGRAKLYLGDARQLPVEDESVDLVATDPPYGYADFGYWTTDEAIEFYEIMGEQFNRIMRPGASLYLFPGWMFYCEARRAISEHLHYLKTLIWDKRTFTATRGDMATLTYHNIAEPIILAYKPGASLTFNLEDVRVPTIHGDPRSNPAGKRPGDILSCIAVRNNAAEKTPHPTQKPEKLIERFIMASSKPGELVVDPFVGSGTTCVVAYRLGRRTIGIDLKEEYLEMAKSKLLQGVLL